MLKTQIILVLFIITAITQKFQSQDYKVLSDNLKKFQTPLENIVSILKKENKKQIFVTKVMPTGILEDYSSMPGYNLHNDDKISIHSEDYENNLFSSNKINLPNIGDKQVKYINSFTSKDNSFLYSYIIIKDELKIFASKINLSTLTLDKHFEIGTYTNENFKEIKLFVNQSEDSSKILITFLHSDLSGNTSLIKEIAFDFNLNKLWTSNFTFEEKYEKTFINNIEIHNNGNSSFLVSKSLDKNKTKDRLRNHFLYSKMFFHDYKNEINHSKLIQNETTHNMLSRIKVDNKKNELILYTIISNSKDNISGYLLKKFSGENFEETSSYDYVFSNEQIEKYTRIKSMTNKQLLSDFFLRELFILPNGNLCSILENNFDMRSPNVITNIRGNIVLLLMNENGLITNEKILYRSENLGETDGSSELGFFLDNENVNILMNESEGNFENIKKNEKTDDFDNKGQYMYLLTFDNNLENFNDSKLFYTSFEKKRYAFGMYPSHILFYGNNLFMYSNFGDLYRTIEIEDVLKN